MPPRVEELRHGRRLAATLDGLARVHLLRTGVHLGLFEALRTPRTAGELAERLGLAGDLVEAWLRAAHAHGLLACREGRYAIGSFVRWLLDAPQAPSLHALLDQGARGYGPRLEALPQLLKGAERPEFSASDEALRLAALARLTERRALRALGRVPGARSARRVLQVGCGFGTFLAEFLRRYRDAHGLGIERVADVAEEARRTLREAEVSRRAEIRVGDFMTMDIPKGTYDLVLVTYGLHHFPASEWPALVRRVLGRLSETGVLVLQTAALTRGPVSRWIGTARWVATANLFLRSHRNVHGLPEVEDLERTLRESGCAATGVVPILPDRSLVHVWGRLHG